MGVATTWSTDGDLSTALIWEFPDLWVTGIVLCLFLSLYRLRIPARIGKLLAFCSGGCYGGYLLSHLLDCWVYTLLPSWQQPGEWIRTLLVVTVPVYFIAILSGRLLQAAVDFLLTSRKKVSV